MASTRDPGIDTHARPTRRQLLAAIGLGVPAAIALPGLAGCGGSSGSSGAAPQETGPVQLAVFWWGTQGRADTTDKVLKLYTQKHPNVTFKQQWQGFSGYYDKLSTMAAGGNAPDVFQIDDNGLTDYTARGVCLDLKPYVGNKIDVGRFPAGLKDSGVVNGKVGGIAAAENTPAMYYDKDIVTQLGLAEPTTGMSWDDIVTFGAQVFQKSAGKIYGTMDPSADYKAFQVWLRQKGKDFYSAAGKFAFGTEDLTAWFQFWSDAAARHATPPADLIHNANGGDVAKQLVQTKKGATSFMWSNQLEALQQGTDHKLGMVTYPGDPKGQWARASMYWSGFSGTKHAGTVASVIDFLVNDPEAAKILGAERGLAPNMEVRGQVSSTLSAPNQTSVAFETGLVNKFGSAPPVPPKGHTQVRALLVKAAESVQYKQASPDKAAVSFMSQANAALGA
jgi:multiple sugar transport system substrate-binding protein